MHAYYGIGGAGIKYPAWKRGSESIIRERELLYKKISTRNRLQDRLVASRGAVARTAAPFVVFGGGIVVEYKVRVGIVSF